MQQEFEGKVVLVTGAASGIGLACAAQYIAAGATVVAGDIDEGALAIAAASLGSRYVGRRMDVTSDADIDATLAFIGEAYGKLDVIVNNAGAGRMLPLDVSTRELYAFHSALLLEAPILIVTRALPLLRKGSDANVVNIASVAALLNADGHGLYGVMKEALVKYTSHAAKEHLGIRSNAVLPGVIDTPLLHIYDGGPNDLRAVAGVVPARRLGRADEIADAIYFLSSSRATYINGASLVVDGGLVACQPVGM